MSGIEDQLSLWLREISHYPVYLYLGVVLLLVASSFGLPVPEEIVLITSGVVASAALTESAATGLSPSLNVWTLALTCFLAVLLSDLLVFYLGRRLGSSLFQKGPLKKVFTPANMERIEKLTKNYGAWACGIFRFTPGLRFPGHFMCGALKISWTKMILVDGTAALLTVPTQVLLLAYYGDEILVYFKQFKIALFSLLAVAFVGWLIYRRRKESIHKKTQSQSDVAA